MAPSSVEIPNRPIFSASEVCAIAGVQAFVLRSWERAFPSLGGTTPKGGRSYRRDDVELVVKIKRLLLEQGLTLDAVRAKLEADEQSSDGSASARKDDGARQPPRERLDAAKTELRAVLALLASDGVPARTAEPAPARKTEAASDAEPPAAAAARTRAGRSRKRRRASAELSGGSS